MSEMVRSAVISKCGRYRYLLTRKWGKRTDFATFVMLNPSTADGFRDDATIRKCIGFAKRWGFDGIQVVNLFAWRSRDPLDLLANDIDVHCEICGYSWTQQETEHVGPLPCELCGQALKEDGTGATTEVDAPARDLYGPDYTRHFEDAFARSSLVIAAWGCESTLNKALLLRARARVVTMELLKLPIPVECLGMSKKGTPYHPLMLAYTTQRRSFAEMLSEVPRIGS